MAEQGRWFKLWVTAPSDPDLGSLSLEDFGRWCILGTYIKTHGTDGKVEVPIPCPPLQNLLRVCDSEQLVNVLKKMPNCDVHEKQNSVTDASVTLSVEWRNWSKYQRDNSLERVRKFRKVKRSKKRREESKSKKRKESSEAELTEPTQLHESPPTKLVELAFQSERLTITVEQDAKLAGVYPHVDRQQAYREAELWLVAKDTTRKNHFAFARNWLAKIPSPGAKKSRAEEQTARNVEAAQRFRARVDGVDG